MNFFPPLWGSLSTAPIFSGLQTRQSWTQLFFSGFNLRAGSPHSNGNGTFLTFFFFYTWAYLMSASMADLSIPLTAWAAGKAALLTLVQSSIFVAYPSAPAMADGEAAISTSKKQKYARQIFSNNNTSPFTALRGLYVHRRDTRAAHWKINPRNIKHHLSFLN